MSVFDKLKTNSGVIKSPATVAEWQTYVDSLTRPERDRLWPGMHKDLIAATEMIEAQARSNAPLTGMWDSVKSLFSAPAGVDPDSNTQQSNLSVDNNTIPLERVSNEQYLAIKDGPRGADVTDLSDEILATYDDIEAVWAMYTDVKPVITSGRDGHTKKPNSLHHKGRAIDVRANNISDKISQQITDALQTRLGYDYYVDFEQPSADPAEDHIHIEYDPK